MKRSVVALSLLVLLITVACASTGSGPATSGVITAVGDNTVTVASNGQSTTYNLTSSTYVYTPMGARAKKSLLTSGQRVKVVANGQEAVTISIES
jgi:hypothetical protein